MDGSHYLVSWAPICPIDADIFHVRSFTLVSRCCNLQQAAKQTFELYSFHIYRERYPYTLCCVFPTRTVLNHDHEQKWLCLWSVLAVNVCAFNEIANLRYLLSHLSWCIMDGSHYLVPWAPICPIDADIFHVRSSSDHNSTMAWGRIPHFWPFVGESAGHFNARELLDYWPFVGRIHFSF